MRMIIKTLVAGALAVTSLSGSALTAQTPESRTAVAGRIAQEHLAKFDTLDFDVFSNQKWDRVKESHSDNIAVHWPDGHVAYGIKQHIEDMKKLFVHAPDTRIKQHPIKIGTGEWTAVTGIMEGTFTKPMTKPDGTVVQPTGKSFKLPMVTVGYWTNGKMNEEYLYWDNATYMTQMGVPK